MEERCGLLNVRQATKHECDVRAVIISSSVANANVMQSRPYSALWSPHSYNHVQWCAIMFCPAMWLTSLTHQLTFHHKKLLRNVTQSRFLSSVVQSRSSCGQRQAYTIQAFIVPPLLSFTTTTPSYTNKPFIIVRSHGRCPDVFWNHVPQDMGDCGLRDGKRHKEHPNAGKLECDTQLSNIYNFFLYCYRNKNLGKFCYK